MMKEFLTRLGYLFRRKPAGDLDEELSFHVAQSTETNIGAGMTPQEARRQALIAFGGVESAREQSHSQHPGWLLDTMAQDLRFTFRQLAKSPGFTSTAIMVLALGIGVTVAIFAFVDAALIEPLPYHDPTRLVHVTESAGLIPRANLSYLDYLDWKRLNRVFSSLDVFNRTGYALRVPSGTELVAGVRVSSGFFGTLGVHPILGRDFQASDNLPSAPDTVLLSYATWQKRYGGRGDVIGQTVSLSGKANIIIGVLPREFEFAPRGAAEFWTTLQTINSCELRRSCHNLEGIGRLKDGVSVQTALADMKSVAKQLEFQYPGSNRDQGASVLPLSEVISGDIRPILLVLLGGAGLLLLIACVNVSSLLLVRSESRKREVAVRNALGASHLRLFRQFVTEGMVLVVSGSALGLVAAYSAIQAMMRLVSKDMLATMPFLQGVRMSLHVLGFAGAIALFAIALFSLAPVLRLSSVEMRDGLNEGGRGSAGTLWRHFGANLVVIELATAVVLLVGAGLLSKSFYRLLHVELGFEPQHLATVQIAVPELTYAKDDQVIAVQQQIRDRALALPGVESVGITSILPVSFNGNTDWIRFVGKPFHGEHNEVNAREISSGYFATLQARLLRGRYFTEDDTLSKPHVVLINQRLAKQYFPGEDPIGQKIGDTSLSPDSIKTVVGMVEDVKEGSLDSEIWPAEYLPFNQSPDSYFSLLARTSHDEASILEALDAAIHQIDPGIGTIGESTMVQHIDESQTAYLHRASAWLVGGFAALALLLGVVGLYGVVAYSVSQRTREIGVRMALGAQRSTVYRLILKEASWLTLLGIAVGLACSLAAATLLRKLLFGVGAWDPQTMIMVAAVLGASALLASYIPARRAASVDPVIALRAE